MYHFDNDIFLSSPFVVFFIVTTDRDERRLPNIDMISRFSFLVNDMISLIGTLYIYSCHIYGFNLVTTKIRGNVTYLQ
jgi:hypothetical protein